MTASAPTLALILGAFLLIGKSRGDSISDLLLKIQFKNEGIIKSSDRYVWKRQGCVYLEQENVTHISDSAMGWDLWDAFNYRYQQLDNGTLVPPPSGIRSAVPLGGVSTGSIELRGDGTLHEWVIMNQTPGGAAKIQVFEEAVFGMRTSVSSVSKKQSNQQKQVASQKSDEFYLNVHIPRSENEVIKMTKEIDEEIEEMRVQIGGDRLKRHLKKLPKEKSNGAQAFVLQTHPPTGLPGVQAMKYQGSHPVSRLEVQDSCVPVEAALYGYSTYYVNNLNKSATPAIAFTLVMKNPSKTNKVDAAFMLNLPLGIEKMQDRSYVEGTLESEEALTVTNDLQCMKLCSSVKECGTWTFQEDTKSCVLYTSVNLNRFNPQRSSGVKGFWQVHETGGNLNCISLVRECNVAPCGNLSICASSLNNQGVATSFGSADDVMDLWNDFAANGKFTKTAVTPESGALPNMHGAMALSTTLQPGKEKSVTLILSWYYPNRDFKRRIYGNFYKHLFADSIDVAQQMAVALPHTIGNITLMQNSLFNSSLPEFLQDIYVNSLGHIRSAFWLADGRWRQWEAYDCPDTDSVHNDGERHIPYITFFPESTKNKMLAWAKSQNAAGMIAEELRVSVLVPGDEIDVPGGRVMSDCSSMFAVYALELYRWKGEVEFVKSLWPNIKKAVQWHIDQAKEYGQPRKLETTYDYVVLTIYDFSAYTSGFHLLALRAGYELALAFGDTDFANTCQSAYRRGVEAIDKYQWNATHEYYNAYTTLNKVDSIDFRLDSKNFRSTLGKMIEAQGLVGVTENLPATPGAVMADSFYAQVVAFSVGLGPLVDPSRLIKHLKAEYEHNETPYGMLVMTGRYPYPGPAVKPFRDNCIWQMANPNWGTLNIHLEQNVTNAINVAKVTLDRWRSIENDQWNAAGITGGVGYGLEGQSFMTSHYGYYMSSWYMIFALTGQWASIPDGILKFNPKVAPPYRYPVLLPGVVGSLEAENLLAGKIQYSLELHFGQLELNTLSVNGVVYPSSNALLRAGDKVTWSSN
ncbi:uncharacterized protein LOC106167159 [Lingula anatina]|uniref:Uncharacterized protein LOC106167159 n=1 Tax=Lingula anatina TaxID=7574 RepID=A0A2R2MNI0_LINAN|nr:uncharacterized protein LOC106167159 [Lingula anatina]XP_023931771.1 uncharacterized protein LOC106167159 [Lingula anatina]|eukprot:XP_023931770.1 uncharacterized protein LOC106167159 [Lingula anatina]